jgi:hypothetical protein
MGKAFMGNTAVWSQLERELTSERVRHALAYKKGQGHWVGTLPAGFKRDSAGGIVVDRPVAQTIRLVFEQYATGAHSFRTLAAWLNRRGIKTIATRGGNGRPPAPLWSGDVLKEVLARPAYGGMLQTADGRIPANLPEMVPIRLWGRCEDVRKRQRFIPGTAPRPRYRTSPFPLVGLLRCGCGATMRGRRTVWRNQLRRLYVCSDRARYGTCPAPPIKADQLEAACVEWLSKCHPDDQLEAAARALVERGLRQRRIPSTEWSERRTVKELEGRLARQRWMYDRGDMPQAEYEAVSAEVKAELARVKALPNEPETVRQRSHRLTDLVAAWTDANADQRARLAASVTVEIQVENARMTAVRPRPAWAPYFEELLVRHGAGDEGLPRDFRRASTNSVQLPAGRCGMKLAAVAGTDARRSPDA